MNSRRIVIIGAGIVGAGLADELALLGETNVTVIDKGPLFETGGSSSHAPGLVSRTSTSKFLTDTADYTIKKLEQLSTAEGPAFPGGGTLEVAYNEARLQELWRRHNAALAFGWRGRMIEPAEALELWPIINPSGLIGGYATVDEGLCASPRAVQALAERATKNGVQFLGDTEVTGFEMAGSRVTGAKTAGGEMIKADVVVVCAGVWSPKLSRMTGVTLPVVPMEHQYAVTTPIAELAANVGQYATMPILRHHDIAIYFRDHGDRVGIGSYHHKGLPLEAGDIDLHPRNSANSLVFDFTDEDWGEGWDLIGDFMPALRDAGLERKFNGIFGFTPDGLPAVGEHPGMQGLWFAASIWITHSQGVARMLAETLVEGVSRMDMAPADLSRFDERELEPSFYLARCDDQYREVYAAHHPAESPESARGLRFSPFADAERRLGAHFAAVATWERPQWFEANAGLVDHSDLPERDAWASLHWSPIAIAEHLATRRSAGLFDMTPLYRVEVAGPGAMKFLDWLVAAKTAGPVGSVVYSVLLDERGGIRSDITVVRLAEDGFWVCGNGSRDLDWLRRHAPSDGSVSLRCVSDELSCVGLWGPAARAILSPIADADLSNAAFPYMTSQELRVGEIDVCAVRISYAGELGWELVSADADGEALWKTLQDAGSRLELIAAGRAALGTLRLEKGYRAWGTDMTPEHSPEEAGIGFAVRRDGSDFLGRDGLEVRPAAEKALRSLVIEQDQVAMGGEPVLIGNEPVGYVTSAGFGPSVGASIALAWVPSSLQIGAEVQIAYFDKMLLARVAEEPLFDPGGERVRS